MMAPRRWRTYARVILSMLGVEWREGTPNFMQVLRRTAWGGNVSVRLELTTYEQLVDDGAALSTLSVEWCEATRRWRHDLAPVTPPGSSSLESSLFPTRSGLLAMMMRREFSSASLSTVTSGAITLTLGTAGLGFTRTHSLAQLW